MRSPSGRQRRRPGFHRGWLPLVVGLSLTLSGNVLPARAAEEPNWQSHLDPGPAGPISPPAPFQASYRLRWNEIEAARADLDFRPLNPGSGEWQTRVEARTLGMARRLWQLDATHVAVAGGPELRPVRLEEVELLAKRRDVFRVRFENGVATRQHRRSQPPGAPEVPDGSDKTFSLPGMRDMNAAFLLARTLPLAAGERHVFVVMSAKNPYRVSMRVIGRGPLQTHGGRFPAIEMEVALDKVDVPTGHLKPHKLFKSARAWMSDDADRVPLKVETQIFLGRITMELETLTKAGGA